MGRVLDPAAGRAVGGPPGLGHAGLSSQWGVRRKRRRVQQAEKPARRAASLENSPEYLSQFTQPRDAVSRTRPAPWPGGRGFSRSRLSPAPVAGRAVPAAASGSFACCSSAQHISRQRSSAESDAAEGCFGVLKVFTRSFSVETRLTQHDVRKGLSLPPKKYI